MYAYLTKRCSSVMFIEFEEINGGGGCVWFSTRSGRMEGVFGEDDASLSVINPSW